MYFPTTIIITLFSFILAVASSSQDYDLKSTDQSEFDSANNIISEPKKPELVDQCTLEKLSSNLCRMSINHIPLLPPVSGTEPEPEPTNGCPVYEASNSKELVQKFCKSYDIIKCSPPGEVTLGDLVEIMCKESNVDKNRANNVAKRNQLPSCPPQMVSRLDRRILKFCKDVHGCSSCY